MCQNFSHLVVPEYWTSSHFDPGFEAIMTLSGISMFDSNRIRLELKERKIRQF